MLCSYSHWGQFYWIQRNYPKSPLSLWERVRVRAAWSDNLKAGMSPLHIHVFRIVSQQNSILNSSVRR